MLLPQSQSICELSFSVHGDVTVHASAAIASGAVLQANLGARLIIEAGVSIGMGCIVHVDVGTLTIETGACLGSGVLIVGSGKIGTNACIGSMTTIINGCVEAGQVIPSESLIGDGSRQVSPLETNRLSSSMQNGATAAASPVSPSPTVESPISPSPVSPSPTVESPVFQSPISGSTPSQPIPEAETIVSEAARSQPESPASARSQPESPATQPSKIYGLNAFNGLMTSLFPHRQSLNQPLSQPVSELDQAPHTPEG